MRKAKIISVEVTDNGDGLFHATSPQIRELFVTGESAEQALERVPEAIEGLFALDGIDVCAVQADNDNLPIPQPWVIVDRETQATSC